MGIIVSIDSKCVADCAEPTDVWDWLTSEHGLPLDLFQKIDENGELVRPTRSDLPIKFFWAGHKYMVSNVDNLRKQQNESYKSEVPEGGSGIRHEGGKFFPFEGNG